MSKVYLSKKTLCKNCKTISSYIFPEEPDTYYCYCSFRGIIEDEIIEKLAIKEKIKNNSESKIKEILQERQEMYGEAAENFRVIGLLWAQLLDLDLPIDPYLVSLMMVILKVWRTKQNPDYQDSWDDIIGYATLGKKTL
jgi:Domain of unknown function (DUF6378)